MLGLKMYSCSKGILDKRIKISQVLDNVSYNYRMPLHLCELVLSKDMLLISISDSGMRLKNTERRLWKKILEWSCEKVHCGCKSLSLYNREDVKFSTAALERHAF